MILNENELNEIKGLLHYLNSAMNGSVQPDKITMVDSSGENVGFILKVDDHYQFSWDGSR